MLKLPDEHGGYWFAQGTLMNQALATVDLKHGDRILDVGSNTCWASATFAVDVRGPRYHTIFTEQPIGLSAPMTARQGFQAAAAPAVRRSARAKRAYLAYTSYVVGATALHKLAAKPHPPA